MNLVPLHVDKETGKIVASGGTGNPHQINGAYGYFHHQQEAATTWVIHHNGQTRSLICQVFDTNYGLLFSQDLMITDINTVTVQFNTPQAGFANIIMFKP